MAFRADHLTKVININWGVGGFVAVGGGRNLQGSSLVFVRIVNGSPVLTNGVLVWSDGLFEAPSSTNFGHDIPTPVISISVRVNYVDVFGADPTEFGGVPGNSKEALFSFTGERLGVAPAPPISSRGATIYTDTDGSRVLITTSSLAKYDSNGVLIWRQAGGGGEAWSISASTEITVYQGGTNLRFSQDGEFLGSTSFDITPGSSVFGGATFDVARDGGVYSRFRVDDAWQLARFSRDGVLQWQTELMPIVDPATATTQIASVGDFIVVASSVGEDTPTRDFHGSFGAGRIRHDHLKIYNASGALVSDTLWGDSWISGTSQAPIERAYINAIQRPTRVPSE